MPDIKNIIKSDNIKMLNKEIITDESYNYRNKNKCPLKSNNCTAENDIYKASVSTKN